MQEMQDSYATYNTNYLPAKTNRIPHTNVKIFLPELQCPTKHIIPPISRINRLTRGNIVARRMFTENEIKKENKSLE